MRYIDTRSISSIPNILEKYHSRQHKNHNLLHDVGLSSLLASKKKKVLTKAQRKRIANERRRKFFANIITRHQDLHEGERNKIIAREKSRILSNIVTRPRSKSMLELQREERNRRSEVERRINSTRDRAYARRVRSRSRWSELLESQVKKV